MNKEPTFSTQKQEHTMYEQGTYISTQKQEHTMYEQGTYIFYTKTRANYV